MTSEIVIVGCGISGLYTAFLLSRIGLGPKITVYAKHMPGDLSVEYPSPVAGANFSSSISGDDPFWLELNALSFKLLTKLVDEYGERAYLERNPAVELWDTEPSKMRLASLKTYLTDLEVITDKKWLESRGAKFGIKYTTFNLYSPFFIKFLKSLLEDLGVTFVRRTLQSIDEAYDASTNVVFNCSGVLAGKLVNDPDCYPIRGQIVVVRAPHIKTNVSLSVQGQPPTYIIPRACSGGRVVLGGYYEEGNWTGETFGSQTASIIDRTTRLWPELLRNGPLEVVVETAGLRPGRKGGPRIEREVLQDGKVVIHNYGAAGTGYQCGLGLAMKAIKLYLDGTSTPLPRL